MCMHDTIRAQPYTPVPSLLSLRSLCWLAFRQSIHTITFEYNASPSGNASLNPDPRPTCVPRSAKIFYDSTQLTKRAIPTDISSLESVIEHIEQKRCSKRNIGGLLAGATARPLRRLRVGLLSGRVNLNIEALNLRTRQQRLVPSDRVRSNKMTTSKASQLGLRSHLPAFC